MDPESVQSRGAWNSISGLDDTALQADNDCMGAIVRP
jgi:hypothetical protein